MDSLSRDDRDRHLITRGNVDGIASTAIFLSKHPLSRVSFVTSPRAAAAVLAMDRTSTEIFLVDIALIDDVVNAASSRLEEQTVYAVDHHPSSVSEELNGIKIVEEGRSAAGVLYNFLHGDPNLKRLVGIADLLEYCDTDLLRDMMKRHGAQRMDEESKILDFSWRLDIDDDDFRSTAAKHLATGPWPSQVSSIKRRYIQVINERRWPKAVARINAGLEVRGGVGIFQCHEKNRSLYGFGTRVLADVCYRRGYQYAVMLNDRKDSCSVSVRGMSQKGLDVGRFVEDFTSRHGIDGGGHPTSAGARIPLMAANRFVEEFVSASLTR